MAHPELDKTIGQVLKELIEVKGFSNSQFARLLTIECLRSIPCSDRGGFVFQHEYNLEKNGTLLTDEIIDDYVKDVHHKQNSIIMVKKNNDLVEMYLSHSITPNTISNYLSGRTIIPMLELLGCCRLLNISYNSFMKKVNKIINIGWIDNSYEDISIEDVYNAFSKKVFGDREDNRYVYNTIEQNHLLSSLFLDGKDEIKLHFTYLPMHPELKDKNHRQVIFQRGELIFTKKNGMCHVTSNVLIGSQGIPSQYKGFAIVMNPKSNGTTCTCFLREVGNTFGVFVLFTFRLSPLDRLPRKTRVSECMAVRRSDGTAFVYRLLISSNYISDVDMNYFVRHLKLCTSENTNEGKELNILIRKKYITEAKEYFNNTTENETISSFVHELKRHFENADKKHLLKLIDTIENSLVKEDCIITVNPDIFDKTDKEALLFLGWLGKYGLSARHDKIENSLDDEVESIHKVLYPELHADMSDEWY